MLRLILKCVAAVVALGLLAVGVLSLVLPRLVNTDEFRAALSASAAEALGTPIEWEHLDAGIIPLRLTMTAPVLVGASGEAETARLRARSVDLRLSALALLEQRVEVESIVLSGVELVVTRTADGLILPIESAAEDAEEEEAATPQASPGAPSDESVGSPETESDGEAVGLAVRRLIVENGRIVIRDRTLPRPLDWQMEDIQLELTGDSLDRPLAVDLESRLAESGREIGGLEVTGEVSLSGLYDLDVRLDALLLETLQPYVSEATLAGALSGSVHIEGANSVVSKTETKLVIEELDVSSFGLDLEGRLELEAEQALDAPVRFDAVLDLANAGKARFDGSMELDGALDAVVMLESLDIEPYAALAGAEMEVGGRASGRVEFATTATSELVRLDTDLEIEDARYADGTLAMAGALDLALGLEGLGPNDPARFDIAMDFAEGGGHVDAEGNATLGGAVDAKLVLANVDLAPIAPLLPEGTRVEGRVTGNADVKLTAERVIERMDARLSLAGGRLVSDPIDLKGKFDLEVGRKGEGPIALDVALALEDGSELRVEGTSTEAGVVDVKAFLTAFDLAIAKPFLPDPEMEIRGRATGEGRLVGEATSPEFLSFDLGIEDGAFVTADYQAEGPFLAVVKVKDPLSRPRGRIDLDLTATSLVYGEQFKKPAGMRAEMTTRFVPEESGEIVFESKLKLRDIDEILLQGSIAESTSVAVTTSNFNLKGWSEVLPVLEPYAADGVVAVDGLAVELIDGAPSQFGGRILLRGIGLQVPEAGEVRLRGSIIGEGTRIRTKGLRARIGGATLSLQATLDDPLGEGRFDLAVRTQGEVEANDVFSNLTSVRDTLFGPLSLDGKVKGLLGADVSVTETLDGNIRLAIGEGKGGRLRGVSILKTVLDQIPLLGGAARLSQPFRGGRSVDDYFSERFDLIEAVLRVGGGQLVADPLRLSYPGYEVRLTGPAVLRDFSLDMTGELLLKGDLVSALVGLAGADLGDRKPIRIELARVTNTLDDPRVSMTKETLAAVPKLLFQATGLDTLTLGIGKSVGKAIDAVIGRDE